MALNSGVYETISSNNIIGNLNGIFGGADNTLTGNYIYANGTGITNGSSLTIYSNHIYANQDGIVGSGLQLCVVSDYIYSNTQYFGMDNPYGSLIIGTYFYNNAYPIGGIWHHRCDLW